MMLRDLDERWVPRLAAALQRAVTRSVDVRRQAAQLAGLPRPRRRPAARPVGPAPFILRLRQVDDRWTRSGPLALLREVPQLVGLALGLLVLVAGATVMARVDRTSVPPDDVPFGSPGVDPGRSAGEADTIVGPVLGDDVTTYLTLARADLVRRAAEEPDERSIAIVHFTRYLVAEDAYRIVRPLNPVRALFRVPPQRGEQSLPVVVPTRRFLKDLRAQYLRLAAEKAQEMRDAESSAATTDDPAFQADYRARARQLRAEIGRLQGRCECVFAAVVVARNADLLAVSSNPLVRGVDLGPPGVTLERLSFQGLLPEEKTTVTGGNEG